MFDLKIPFNQSGLDRIKGDFTRILPHIKSSHRCEAIGRGLGSDPASATRSVHPFHVGLLGNHLHAASAPGACASKCRRAICAKFSIESVGGYLFSRGCEPVDHAARNFACKIAAGRQCPSDFQGHVIAYPAC